MELFVHFPKYPNKDYCISAGPTFTQNYNESLDSGSIRIDHIMSDFEAVPPIDGKLPIKPYDDAIVYSGTLRKKANRYDVIQGTNFTDSNDSSRFYAHFLVGDFNANVNFKPNSKKGYSYTISLVSETKALEKIPLPNISITQPRNGNIITIGSVIQRLVNEYGPMSKTVGQSDENLTTAEWSLSKRYVVNPSDPCWDGIWDAECPEHTFNNPTMRNVLDFILSSKDRIVVVHDWVIQCIDITATNNNIGDFTNNNSNVSVNISMSAGDYCDRLRTDYSDGLPSKTVTHYVERLGFRNSDEAIMTLKNMRLEFSHPIYRIKKINMCYYRETPEIWIEDAYLNDDVPQEIVDLINEMKSHEDEPQLVKRDITPLVILNERRDLLSENWTETNFMSDWMPAFSIDDIAKYRMCTVGYDIGSTIISGWGQTYSYQNGYFKGERSYIENLVTFLEMINYPIPIGNAEISDDDEIWMYSGPNEFISEARAEVQRIIYQGDAGSDFGTFFHDLSEHFKSFANDHGFVFLPNGFTLRLKSIFFEVEYEGFIDSAVIASKDIHDGFVQSIDAQSQSLALIEPDGVAKKEKVNRLGNETVTISTRETRFSDVKCLGDFTSNFEIIYMSKITIFKDYIATVYYLCKDYVLKNYYTSVLSKLRPFPMASYNESVLRKENKTIEVFISSKESFSHSDWDTMPFGAIEYDSNASEWKRSSDLSLSSALISFFVMSDWDDETFSFIPKQSINMCAVDFTDGNYYLVDTQCFNFGYSMCANITMDYSIKTKAWISRFRPNFWEGMREKMTAFFSVLNNAEGYVDMLSGALESYYMVPTTNLYQTEGLRFMAIAVDKSVINDYFEPDENGVFSNGRTVDDIMEDTLLNYPKANSGIINSANSFALVSKSITKDQKEKVSMTMQFEPISDSDDIQFSEYFLLLSDLYDQHYKANHDIVYVNESAYNFIVASGSAFYNGQLEGTSPYITPCFMVYLKVNNVEFEHTFDEPVTLLWDKQIRNLSGVIDVSTDAACPNLKVAIELHRIARDANDIENHTVTCDFTLYLSTDGTNWTSVIQMNNTKIVGGIGGINDYSKFPNPPTDVNNVPLPYSMLMGFGTYTCNLASYAPTTTNYNVRASDIEPTIGTFIYNGYEYPRYIQKSLNDSETHSVTPIPDLVPFNRYDVIQSYSKVAVRMFMDDLGNISGEKTVRRSYYCYLCPKMDYATKYEKISAIPANYMLLSANNGSGFSIEQDSDNRIYIKGSIIEALNTSEEYSIRCYYYDSDDSLYHFVYGQNFKPTSQTENYVKAYISFLDSRERTVYKTDGDAYGRIANCAPNGDGVPYGQPTAIKVY